MVFLELRRDSRVTTGNSGCLLCWPRQVQSSIRVAKESWGLLSSDCRANRPHLGLCPEANVPLQGRQGSRGCIPDAPGETGIHLEWKQRTPLCSRIATGISWSSLGGLKGVKPPEAFGERSRDWSLGHAGDEGPHLSMTGESRGCSRAAAPVCGFSRGTTARSVSLSWGAREVQSSIRVAKESWGLLSSDCRADRPHLGLCPEAEVPLQGRPGSRGCIPDAPGETGIHLEWKQRTPLCSRVATGISWSSLGGLKGVKPPEAFGERSRGWPLGHAGDEGPHLRDDGGVSGWFSSGGPRVRFLTRYDGEVSEPLVGRQGSRVSMRVARGSASLLSSHGRGIWPRDVLKKVSRGLSRVEAGNPGFPRLVQVTSGGFSWWL